ncbi:DUF6515 family protein [Mucilaginibacter calamicampi]|uniref:DUF6515 family protein n=1 Tax=Mucilaginibacter calamicampi TaxID=1302352 RepID=A0ABW2Z131_9SPHI
MKNHHIKLTGALLLIMLFIAAEASAQRRGVTGGGAGPSQGGSAGMGMARPQQPSIAPPQSYSPPRGGDNSSQGYGRRGGSVVAPQGQQGNGRQPNTYPPRTNSYPGMPRRGVDVNIARGSGAFGRPSTRQLAGSNRVYRVWDGLPYGRNYISVRPQGVYYNHNGYYSSYYAPRIGLSVSVLPYGYYPFYYGPSLYYYGGGMYYQQTDNTFTVVEPPIGAEVKQLPDNAQSIVINGVQYYELNGVYYQPITKDDGTLSYQIAGKDGELNTDDVNAQDAPPIQVGDLVDNLPEDYRKINLNGEKYYVTPSGYYLQDAGDENGKKVYKIISVPVPDADDGKK